MNDTIALITAMEQLDLQRDAAKASNELMLSVARIKKTQGFLDFYKEVKDDEDTKRLLGITDDMKLEDFVKCYRMISEMQ